MQSESIQRPERRQVAQALRSAARDGDGQLRSYAAANAAPRLGVEHRQHKGLNNQAENSQQPTRVREQVMQRFTSARQPQRFASIHAQVSNLFVGCRYHRDAQQQRAARIQAMATWERAACARIGQ
nr:hypothetical protein [Burkholderia glumae]